MAKSVRSKSLRKAKALKRAAVFKPVDDARVKRFADKIQTAMDDERKGSADNVMLSEEATSLAGPAKYRNRKKLAPFSAYGLSAKELRF